MMKQSKLEKLLEYNEMNNHRLATKVDSMSVSTTSVTVEEPENFQVEYDQSETTCSSKRKRVCFNESSNEYHAPEQRKRTRYEYTQCWYTDSEIKALKDDTMKAANTLFGPQQQASNNNNNKSRFLGRRSTSGVTLPTGTKRSMAVAYRDCNTIRNEEDFYAGQCPLNRSDLVQAYQAVDDYSNESGQDLCLVGLEMFILYGLRGQRCEQTRYILEATRQRVAGGLPQDYDYWMRMTSQYISLPSRVFVRELAMAQAEALRVEREQEL